LALAVQVFYELWALRVPFAECKTVTEMVVSVAKGKRPAIPSKAMPPVVRRLITAMWHADSQRRPTAAAVLTQLQALSKFEEKQLFAPPPESGKRRRNSS
jgi:hypothetical protein